MERTPEELILAYGRTVKDHSNIGQINVLEMLIDQDPRFAKYIYKREVKATLTKSDMEKISNCKTPENARSLYKKLLKQRPGEYCIDPSVATRLKNMSNKRGCIIYGAHGLGYVHEDDLTEEDAAKFLRNQIRTLQGNTELINGAINTIETQSSTDEQLKVVKDLKLWSRKSLDYDFLKSVGDRLESEFLND